MCGFLPEGGCPRRARRGVSANYVIANCWPARRLYQAGYSSGTGVCARGGCSVRRGGSIAALCVRFMPVLRSCRGVLRSAHACLFSFVRKRETACGVLRFYSAWVGIAFCAFSNAVRLLNFAGSLLDCAFFAGDSDGVTTGAGYTKRNAAICGRSF